jgi:hypothetical protein
VFLLGYDNPDFVVAVPTGFEEIGKFSRVSRFKSHRCSSSHGASLSGFVSDDCLPCNLTLNFTVGAVRPSRLSSLGMGGLTVPRMGKTRGHSSANALLLLSPSSWVARCETKRNKVGVFICVS